MGVLAAGVGFKGIVVNFQASFAQSFCQFFQVGFFHHGTAKAFFPFQYLAGSGKTFLGKITRKYCGICAFSRMQYFTHGAFFKELPKSSCLCSRTAIAVDGLFQIQIKQICCRRCAANGTGRSRGMPEEIGFRNNGFPNPSPGLVACTNRRNHILAAFMFRFADGKYRRDHNTGKMDNRRIVQIVKIQGMGGCGIAESGIQRVGFQACTRKYGSLLLPGFHDSFPDDAGRSFTGTANCDSQPV